MLCFFTFLKINGIKMEQRSLHWALDHGKSEKKRTISLSISYELEYKIMLTLKDRADVLEF